jgi:hypothetical protein
VHLLHRATERINETTVVDREYELNSLADADAPARTSALGRHTTRIRRPNASTEATSSVHIQGTATHFHVTVDLAVWVDGLLHHSRQWTESVPRQLL